MFGARKQKPCLSCKLNKDNKNKKTIVLFCFLNCALRFPSNEFAEKITTASGETMGGFETTTKHRGDTVFDKNEKAEKRIVVDVHSALKARQGKWARSCENVSYAICEQQWCRSACASAQSDQHLCCSLLRLYYMYTCYIQSFKILASFCSWAGWFEYYLVESPRSHIFAWRVSNDITDTQTKAPDGFDRDFPHKQYSAKYESCQNIVHLMSTNVTMCKKLWRKIMTWFRVGISFFMWKSTQSIWRFSVKSYM